MRNKKHKEETNFWCTGLTEKEYKKRRLEYEHEHPDRFLWEGVDKNNTQQIEERKGEHEEVYAKKLIEGEEKTCYVCKRKEGTGAHFIQNGFMPFCKTSTEYWDSSSSPLEIKPVRKELTQNLFISFNLCQDCRVLLGFEEDPQQLLRSMLENLENKDS